MELSLQNISFSYGDKVIFSDFSHQFSFGKWHGLLGRSGIGKTSMLRLIAGLITPITGKIIKDNRLKTALLAQEDHLLPWYNVWDNILIGYHLRGDMITNDIKDMAYDLLQKFSLHHYSHSYPHHLSGGMKQRVALIRTMIEKADITLLDEPLSACDHLTKKELYPIMQEYLCDDNRLVMMVSHDQHMAEILCHELWLYQQHTSQEMQEKKMMLQPLEKQIIS